MWGVAGVAPDSVHVMDDGSIVAQVVFNTLRPEALESIFYMWRVTGNPMYPGMGMEDLRVLPPVVLERSRLYRP